MKSCTVSKLVKLRQKTDRELLILVQRELERALALAHVAATKESPLYVQAERAHESAKKLLYTISDMSREERAALGANVKELRLALDQVSAEAAQGYTCSTSAS